MKIILLGPPGSGKGTQGDLIEKAYGFPRISTGDLLRQAVEEETLLGKKAEAFMSKGLLVSDDLVIALIEDRVKEDDCRKGYILDGFPRSIAQARALQKIDKAFPTIVIDIQLQEEALVTRLSSRWICSRCQAVYNLFLSKPGRKGICDLCGGPLIQREDDSPDIIKERLRIYREKTEKLIDFYLGKKLYKRVDGTGTIEMVFRRVCEVLDRQIARLAKNEARK